MHATNTLRADGVLAAQLAGRPAQRPRRTAAAFFFRPADLIRTARGKDCSGRFSLHLRAVAQTATLSMVPAAAGLQRRQSRQQRLPDTKGCRRCKAS
jgi:hypothetical protein